MVRNMSDLPKPEPTCRNRAAHPTRKTLMANFTSPAQRLLLAGGFAIALSAAPLVAAFTVPTAGPALASCPAGEVLDPTSGACKPNTLNPIDPAKVPLQTGELTSSRPGDVGSLPAVNGIPCNSNSHGGGSTGECIGLEQSQAGSQVQEGHAAGPN